MGGLLESTLTIHERRENVAALPRMDDVSQMVKCRTKPESVLIFALDDLFCDGYVLKLFYVRSMLSRLATLSTSFTLSTYLTLSTLSTSSKLSTAFTSLSFIFQQGICP